MDVNDQYIEVVPLGYHEKWDTLPKLEKSYQHTLDRKMRTPNALWFYYACTNGRASAATFAEFIQKMAEKTGFGPILWAEATYSGPFVGIPLSSTEEIHWLQTNSLILGSQGAPYVALWKRDAKDGLVSFTRLYWEMDIRPVEISPLILSPCTLTSKNEGILRLAAGQAFLSPLIRVELNTVRAFIKFAPTTLIRRDMILRSSPTGVAKIWPSPSEPGTSDEFSFIIGTKGPTDLGTISKFVLEVKKSTFLTLPDVVRVLQYKDFDTEALIPKYCVYTISPAAPWVNSAPEILGSYPMEGVGMVIKANRTAPPKQKKKVEKPYNKTGRGGRGQRTRGK